MDFANIARADRICYRRHPVAVGAQQTSFAKYSFFEQTFAFDVFGLSLVWTSFCIMSHIECRSWILYDATNWQCDGTHHPSYVHELLSAEPTALLL